MSVCSSIDESAQGGNDGKESKELIENTGKRAKKLTKRGLIFFVNAFGSSVLY